MSASESTAGQGERVSAFDAKARLLAWAEETDARKALARSSPGSMAAKGALAVLGGVAIVRMLRGRRAGKALPAKSVGRRLISWAVVARVGAWALPLVIRAVQSSGRKQAAG